LNTHMYSYFGLLLFLQYIEMREKKNSLGEGKEGK